MGRVFWGMGVAMRVVGQRVPVAYLPDDPARTTPSTGPGFPPETEEGQV
ncbi:hypothetical protein [uncultured Meiothermus sp.]|jgi:hypothetical protein|nr:hypothetical protein [uncultured Meiothermus sp.]